jgi:hypothetical protein
MIAIHFDKRPHSFSQRWIEYCEDNHMPYKLVNCYSSDIIEQVMDCDGLMWHWYQGDIIGVQFARQLTCALERMGKRVFPDSNTGWTFDDKISQLYLLKAIDCPVVPSYVFYEEEEALEWINSTTFPKVFKLKGGAGSVNVKLVRSKSAALALAKKAFGKGFPSYDRVALFKDNILKMRTRPGAGTVIASLKAFGRIFIPTKLERYTPWERGYLYFQDFIPDNEYDTRLIVIGNRCFGLRRYNRQNDFRASGSGNFGYNEEFFDRRCIRLAFETSKKLNVQSMAYDFIMDERNEPLMVEMSYCFSYEAYEHCPGYWDDQLVWHEMTFKPLYFIVEDFINSIKSDK